jgi:hypothetical protein
VSLLPRFEAVNSSAPASESDRSLARVSSGVDPRPWIGRGTNCPSTIVTLHGNVATINFTS